MFLGLKLFFVYFNEVADVTKVPTDIRNLDNLFLLNNEADVLFFAVNGPLPRFYSCYMRENGRNCLRLNYFKCYLGGKNPG